MYVSFPADKHTTNILIPYVLFLSFLLRGQGEFAISSKNVVWNCYILKYLLSVTS